MAKRAQSMGKTDKLIANAAEVLAALAGVLEQFKAKLEFENNKARERADKAPISVSRKQNAARD